MGSIDPAQAQFLRGQHADLRKTVEAARLAAKRALDGIGLANELQDGVTALSVQLRHHLEEEERVLEPIFATLGNLGPIRIALLRAEHAHQRAVLSILTGPRASPACAVVAERMLNLCDDLDGDMGFEERELFALLALHDAPPGT